MTPQHTPAPWIVLFSKNGYPYAIHAPNADDNRPGVVGSSVTRWGAFSLPSSAEALANARVMAASPKLLEACETALAFIDRGMVIDADTGAGIVVLRLRNAVAEAKGRA